MPPSQQSNLTPEQLREIVRQTVRETVEETFIRLGVQIDDPLEVQKDFQHLRDWRVTTQAMKAKALLAAVGIMVSGFTAALWLGFKDTLPK